MAEATIEQTSDRQRMPLAARIGRRTSAWAPSIGVHVLLILAVVVSVFPFYWMFVGATLPSSEVFRVPPRILPGSHLAENIRGLNDTLPFIRAFLNSCVVAVAGTALGTGAAAAAGYAFAKFAFPGRELIFFVLLMSVMVPAQATIVPLFLMFSDIGWLNTYQALILPSPLLPLGIFLMRQQMKAVPDELIDAARVDGCGEFRIFLKIVLPVAWPAVAALGILMFTQRWMDFLWPLVAAQTEDMYTLPVALATLAGRRELTDYGGLLAGCLIATVPMMIVFFALQRRFVSGLTAGAVKQ
jgi:lactose/L-arabinose transport system permease protein